MNEKPSIDQAGILDRIQEEVRFLQEALEKYNHQFDAETLKPISEELSALTQNILEMDKNLRMLKNSMDKPEIKKDQT
jgi:hypothetical protein